ncbi:MAG: o-succinylbenzoate synthase [Scytolyngbya sp. HA4215-MV1]|nr:o-succinylbenzoate synthase [Scytolyngbya sp. HA4215-MV1]
MRGWGEGAVGFGFSLYRRRFKRSLLTHHGLWSVREGILIRLVAPDGQVGWGEIAPLDWFGSETLAAALEFCRQLPEKITAGTIGAIPENLPACQFGFESAWEEIGSQELGAGSREPGVGSWESGVAEISRCRHVVASSLSHSTLLPTASAALHAWQAHWEQGDRTFKWKIGVATIAEELGWFKQLMGALPAGAKLRLDANGGLTEAEAIRWLTVCQGTNVEFLEQPLPREQLTAMLALSERFATPIALDESVATLTQLQACYNQGWRGVFVVKPAIAGSPARLRQFCQQYRPDVVFSSVFETEVGRSAALRLAAELSFHNRAVGFGVGHWFEEAGVGGMEWRHEEVMG